MARSLYGNFIGAAAAAHRRDTQDEIDFWDALARKQAEDLDVEREWKIMQACERVFGDLFVEWYDSPAVPAHGFARDRIALIRVWAKEQARIARSITPQTEEACDIVHELVKAAEYADQPERYDAPDPHAVVESYLLDRKLQDTWADLPEIEL